MRIQFLGTGAAEGIPALFCQCDFCKWARANGQVRSRSQILLDGELSIDYPPDAFYHAACSGADFSAIRYLFVTHAHMDHFFAGDFVLRGYKYATVMTAPVLDLYCNAETEEVYREVTRRELKPEIGANIRLHPVRPFEQIRAGEWTVYPLLARHSSREPVLYLFEKGGKRILHLHDTALLPEEDYAFLASLGGAPLDAVILDCTFLFDRADEHARHMGLHENAKILARLEELALLDGHTKRIVTHFSHNSAPTPERLARAEAEFGVTAAFDGMELEI